MQHTALLLAGPLATAAAAGLALAPAAAALALAHSARLDARTAHWVALVLAVLQVPLLRSGETQGRKGNMLTMSQRKVHLQMSRQLHRRSLPAAAGRPTHLHPHCISTLCPSGSTHLAPPLPARGIRVYLLIIRKQQGARNSMVGAGPCRGFKQAESLAQCTAAPPETKLL